MKTTFKISKGVICTNLPDEAIRKIEKDLSFPNPVYVNAMNQGRYISSDIPAELELFEIEKSKAWIPRGYIFYLIRWMKEHNHKYKVKDHTLLLKPLNLKFKGELRPYQMDAATDMLSYPIGVLDANTGSGKTVMLIYIIVQRQQPALIIVHSKELLYQWEDRILQFTGESCGLIGDGKFKIKPITVGIINTIKNKISELQDKFGMIIVDEVHKIAATSYMDTLQEFPAKYYQGATATSFRRDGLGHT
ncbi:MAG: ATP-dependent helicase, partial [Bacteroidetes bacterium]